MLTHLTTPSGQPLEQICSWLDQTGSSVHLMGIGGIGMAGLAHVLLESGFQVSGSDLRHHALIRTLEACGARIHRGHAAEHVPPGTAWAIRSTAIPSAHPEIEACRERRVPVFQRGAVLAALANRRRSIAVSGTHGKTTTAAMIAQVIERAGMQPGWFIGGEQARTPPARLGEGPLFVAEADESDGTVALHTPAIAVITNIEYDHMEHFTSPAHMEECFLAMMQGAREQVVYGHDNPAARRLAEPLPRRIGFGITPGADVRGEIIHESAGQLTFRLYDDNALVGPVTLPVHGAHNMLNALAAYAVARTLQIDRDTYRDALADFSPVARRFEQHGTWRGARVISDYAHHPTAIRATLAMARHIEGTGRLVVIFEPHRYSRTQALKQRFVSAFEGAHLLILCPVYAASEQPIPGGTSADLLEVLPHFPAGPARLAESVEHAWQIAARHIMPGDILLLIGAGDVDAPLRASDPTSGIPVAEASGVASHHELRYPALP